LLLPLAEFTPRAEFTGLAAGATLPRRAALALGRLGALGAPRAEAAEGAWLVVSEAESWRKGIWTMKTSGNHHEIMRMILK
jgi:hypothetical protein